MPKDPPRRARYDELHDKYHQILTTKAGTRYKRLAAVVFKALEDKNAVIHDLSLSGNDPEVKHQIDIMADVAGSKKRIVIEFKDFDISKDNIGQDIIRNFRSVIEDTNADEGIFITCNGFTLDAQKYARSKGIKLVILRVFETHDMARRIAKIVVLQQKGRYCKVAGRGHVGWMHCTSLQIDPTQPLRQSAVRLRQRIVGWRNSDNVDLARESKSP
jgi:hypothetical protein